MSQLPVTSPPSAPADGPGYNTRNYLNAEAGVGSWLFTRDHKRIALMYLVLTSVAFALGGFFALLIRTELLTPAPPLATVTVKGVDHDVVLSGDRAVIGRLATSEISLTDVNVSREHAAFEREGMGWAIHDLGSTNGTLVNGKKIDRERLRDGDMIVVGVTELIYHEPRG